MFGRYTGRDRRRAAFDIRKVPLLMSIVAVSPLFVFGASPWSYSTGATIQTFGTALVIVCIMGRTWCSLFIGGRKTYDLVTGGPYALTRNPLYSFSIIGAAGAGAQFGSLTLAMVAAGTATIVLRRRILQEEQRLLALHGDAYRHYMARVPRFLPRGSSWKSGELRITKPGVRMRTFLDSCLFFMAVPLAEIVQHLQHSGAIPVLLSLP